MDPQDNLSRAQLLFLNYEVVELDNGAKIYLKKKPVAVSDEKKTASFDLNLRLNQNPALLAPFVNAYITLLGS